MTEIIRTTTSICPECMKPIPAEIYVDDETQWVMMKKQCKDHGEFKDKISINKEDYIWQNSFCEELGCYTETKPEYVSSGIKETKKGCPYDCGICENHKSAPCIALIDTTNRCNLVCPVCFANANATGYVVEPTYDQLIQILKHFRSMEPVPPPLLQISGGEPTMRDDLFDFIREAKELGFVEVMLTTNGVKLGKSVEYCRKLKEAGCDAVYLSFDGCTPETYKKVRGVNLWPLKQKVIENCREVGLTGVMLVPTICKGLNDHEIANIMNYAKENTDVIGGVIFQPVSLCGRITYEELMDLRYTTSDLKVALNECTQGALTHFYPIATTSKFTRLVAWFDDTDEWAMTSHHDCGFATICIVTDEGEWEPIENYFDVEGLIRWSNKVWDMVQNREVPKPTNMLGSFDIKSLGKIGQVVGDFIDGMADAAYRNLMRAYFFGGLVRYIKNPQRIFTSKTLQNFAKIVFRPSLQAASDFLLSKNLMISAMHFQDAYNFDLNRVQRCLVHYGVIDPNVPSKILEIPFCAYNTIHRPHIEEALAKGKVEKTPQEVQQEIEELVSQVQK
jgi:uncharacterized radical SAM superfamily Fe-S cluster-containing enzyme